MTNARRALLFVIASTATLLGGLARGEARSLAPVQRTSSLPLSTMAGLPIPMPAQSAHGKIQHVVIIMQENRGMDNLFQGYPGADTRSYGIDQTGKQIPLQPIPFNVGFDIEHDVVSFAAAYDNGKMDGFSNEAVICGSDCPPNAIPPNPQYAYVPRTEVMPYFTIASRYVLADRMFTSHIDDSFISHQYIIAAQANHTGYFPLSVWGCDGGPSDTIHTLLDDRSLGKRIPVCWDIPTLGDELDKAHLTWRFYASSLNGNGNLWSPYQVIRHIRYGRDWKRNVKSPQRRVLSDIQNGELSNVTWITPTCATSDHTGCDATLGPSWVSSIIDTIGESKFWNTTAIFVLWDEWGGWYDHVPPPYVDYDGLGMRVPLLVVSPYAKQGYVSHVQYEQGSLLRFAEDQFGLARLAASDTRSNSPAVDCFDFSHPPRPFTAIPSQFGPDYFIHAAPDLRVPDAE